MDEFGIIRRYFSPLTKGFSGALGLGDDAALLDVPAGMQLVVTKDAICEGVHFRGDEPPALIAQKLLRTNLSDLAAKGAQPWCYFLAVSLPKGTTEQFVADFARGLAKDQKQFGIRLAGGDTTSTPGPMVFSLTALGLVAKGKMLRRNSAKAGDLLCVSGMVGDAALGLLKPENRTLNARYLLPQPRVELGLALQNIASACMDMSDGLVQDAEHLCSASKCSAIIDVTKVPLSSAARKILKSRPELMHTILTGGDDYELLFTVPTKNLAKLKRLKGVSVIGQIKAGKGVNVLDAKGAKMSFLRSGYRHF